jgi:hypothetical protein
MRRLRLYTTSILKEIAKTPYRFVNPVRYNSSLAAQQKVTPVSKTEGKVQTVILA